MVKFYNKFSNNKTKSSPIYSGFYVSAQHFWNVDRILEDFEKFDSAPFRSPGCHDDEKRERTLSCGALCARQTCWNGPRASCMWS